MSYRYMVKDSICDIHVEHPGDPSIEFEGFTCYECPRAGGSDVVLNALQMLDHVELVHAEQGDKVYDGGVETLSNFADYWRTKVSDANKKIKKQAEKDSLKSFVAS